MGFYGVKSDSDFSGKPGNIPENFFNFFKKKISGFFLEFGKKILRLIFFYCNRFEKFSEKISRKLRIEKNFRFFPKINSADFNLQGAVHDLKILFISYREDCCPWYLCRVFQYHNIPRYFRVGIDRSDTEIITLSGL